MMKMVICCCRVLVIIQRSFGSFLIHELNNVFKISWPCQKLKVGNTDWKKKSCWAHFDIHDFQRHIYKYNSFLHRFLYGFGCNANFLDGTCEWMNHAIMPTKWFHNNPNTLYRVTCNGIYSEDINTIHESWVNSRYWYWRWGN